MHLREGLLDDLPYLADIATEALWNDEIVRYLAPNRVKHPESHRDNYLYRTKKHYFQGDRLIVIVTDQDDHSWTGRETIAGFAFWSDTLGTSTKYPLPTSSLGNGRYTTRSCCTRDRLLTHPGFERFILRVEGLYRWYMNIDRSYDKIRFAKFWDVLARYPFFEDIANYWELELLAIHPTYQRQGFGSLLLMWGMKQAALYQMPVVVAATFNGEHLYRKHGFEECGRIDFEESAFSWTAMIWTPPAAA